MGELLTALQNLGLPFAYHHFAEGEAPDPPFIIYLVSGSDNFFADDRVYQGIESVQIELYTDRKDPAMEEKVEAALDSFCWEKSEAYVDTERLYQIIYRIEV